MDSTPTDTAAMEESMVVGMVMQQPVSSMGGSESEEKKMKVMVAVDESEGSFYALSWALDHLFSGPTPADNEKHGRVTVVTVQQPFQHYAFPSGPGGAGYLFIDLLH